MKTKPVLQLAFSWAPEPGSNKPGIAEGFRVSSVSSPIGTVETPETKPTRPLKKCGIWEWRKPREESATQRSLVPAERVDGESVVHDEQPRSESDAPKLTGAEDSESRASTRDGSERAQLDAVAFERALQFARLSDAQLSRLARRQPSAFVAGFWVAIGRYPRTRYVELSGGRPSATIGGCS